MSDKSTNPNPDTKPSLEFPQSGQRLFRIPGDTVNAATAHLDDDQRGAIRWFHAYCSEHDLPLKEACAKIRYDDTTLYRVFVGKYEGSLDNVCKQIEEFKALEIERNKGKKLPFIETSLARKIWGVCHASLEFQRIGFIFGDTQIGKTEALIKYRDDHNHGGTIYVRMPTGGFSSDFLAELARVLRISSQSNEIQLKSRIIKAFDDRMLLIIDEAHQCTMSNTGANRGIRSLEFVREIYDAKRCGVVICGTNVFRESLESGRFAGILKQSRRRRLAILQLPSIPSAEDLRTFAAAYGLEPATEKNLNLQTDMIRDEGLGMWLTLLRMAAKCAAKRGKKMGWNHVQEAYAGLRKLEGFAD